MSSLNAKSSSKEEEEEEPPCKRSKQNDNNNKGPRSFVTWNCNGLTSRCLHNRAKLQQLVQQTNHAHVYCLQEVRLKCNGMNTRGTPLAKELQSGVQSALEDMFGRYQPYWSLADKKYAGTCTLVRKDCLVTATAFSHQAALNVLYNKFDLTPGDCGITARAPPPPTKTKKKQQSSKLTSFFQSKPPSSSTNSSGNNGTTKPLLPTQGHDPEGRFQFLQFPGLDLIQTYVPNNGDRPETFARRRLWDETMEYFLHCRKQIYQTARVEEPLLIWCGDLNVARDYRDGSHWVQQQPLDNGNGNDNVYEWWTDEAKCLSFRKSSHSNNDPTKSKHPDNVGIASFTPAERSRFTQLVASHDFCDVWRELHPNGVVESSTTSLWDRPNYTWRGHLSKDPTRPSKYEGKGQRLDYFLLSPSCKASTVVKSCDILGHGRLREGLFCGSDHCACRLCLVEKKTSIEKQVRAVEGQSRAIVPQEHGSVDPCDEKKRQRVLLNHF